MAKVGDIIDGKKVMLKIGEGDNPQDAYCTTYQMRNFYSQFKDGFISNLDVMNYIQHFKAGLMAKKDMTVVDVCCGRSLMLPLLRYYAKDIKNYIGVDISETNIKEAKKGASNKGLKEEDLKDYYPFDVDWILTCCSKMAEHIEHKSADLVIYTSAIEHMHKDIGYQSLKECYKIMNDNSIMFLSCPNTPGNGYDTQYAAHIYEWGYDELKEALDEIGFEIIQEVGLVMGAKEMNEFYATQSTEIQEFYKKLKAYIPTQFLTAIMGVPYPKASKEILFFVRKKNENKLF
jgi:2-polyprenyl-3-methyl-5-hydroxy-6-metoxy-1,4-benzoquinol methylase